MVIYILLSNYTHNLTSSQIIFFIKTHVFKHGNFFRSWVFFSFNPVATGDAWSPSGTFIIRALTAWNYFPITTPHTTQCSNTVHICHQKSLALLFSLLSHESLKTLKQDKVEKQTRISERLWIHCPWFWHSPGASYRNKTHTKIQFVPLHCHWTRHFWKLNQQQTDFKICCNCWNRYLL